MTYPTNLYIMALQYSVAVKALALRTLQLCCKEAQSMPVTTDPHATHFWI